MSGGRPSGRHLRSGGTPILREWSGTAGPPHLFLQNSGSRKSKAIGQSIGAARSSARDDVRSARIGSSCEARHAGSTQGDRPEILKRLLRRAVQLMPNPAILTPQPPPVLTSSASVVNPECGEPKNAFATIFRFYYPYFHPLRHFPESVLLTSRATNKIVIEACAPPRRPDSFLAVQQVLHLVVRSSGAL